MIRILSFFILLLGSSAPLLAFDIDWYIKSGLSVFDLNNATTPLNVNLALGAEYPSLIGSFGLELDFSSSAVSGEVDSIEQELDIESAGLHFIYRSPGDIYLLLKTGQTDNSIKIAGIDAMDQNAGSAAIGVGLKKSSYNLEIEYFDPTALESGDKDLDIAGLSLNFKKTFGQIAQSRTFGNAGRSGNYYGISLGSPEINKRDISATESSIKLGISFSNRFNIEARYGYANGSAIDVNYLAGYGRFNLLPGKGRVIPYVLLGIGRLAYDTNMVSFTVKETATSGGLGLELYGAGRVAINVEFLTFNDTLDNDYDILSLGFIHHY